MVNAPQLFSGLIESDIQTLLHPYCSLNYYCYNKDVGLWSSPYVRTPGIHDAPCW